MLLLPTRVAPSEIHGLGLFAAAPIPEGTPVWRFVRDFDREFSPAEFEALPAVTQNHVRWFSFVRREDSVRVLSGDHACFMNHSHHPNTGLPLPITPTPETPPAESAVTVARRPIAGGEEITCDYFAFDAEASDKLSLG